MKDIAEEERSVVVEGYVFSTEVRELRSGRQLLTFEITDYTSSFAVKKFSRNEADEPILQISKRECGLKFVARCKRYVDAC